MNNRATWILLMLILLGVCAYLFLGGIIPPGISTAVPTTETPQTEEPAITEVPSTEPATTEPATEQPTEAPIATQPPEVFPTPVGPVIPTEDKPSLTFSEPVQETGPVIGFTLPDGGSTVPLKLAPFTEIKFNPPGELTTVAIVEIGEGGAQAQRGMYEVQIDIIADSAPVNGQLVSLTGGESYNVMFDREVQIVNPARIDSPYGEFMELGPVPETAAAIGGDGICIVINIAVPGLSQSLNNYFRFCSVPGSVLSVQQNFGEQYGVLRESMTDAAGRFDLQNLIDQNGIISEKESIQGLKACAAEPTAENCRSDITVAPVNPEFFQENYNAGRAKSPGNGFVLASLLGPLLQDGEPFSVLAAVVKIQDPIETALGLVEPGEYQLEYWFDASGTFYAATITGVRLDSNGQVIGDVTNKPVPAVPATFVDPPTEGEPEPQNDIEPGAQISACRIFGRCTFFQRICP